MKYLKDIITFMCLIYLSQIIKYAGECFEKKEAGTMSTEEMYRYRITKAFGDYGINISTDDSEKFQQ